MAFIRQRPSVTVLTGLWMAICGMMAADKMGADSQIVLVIGAVLFAGGASLAVVMLKEMIALVTSLQGAILFIGGLIIMFNQAPTVWMHVRSLIVSNPIFGPFMIISGTVIGFYAQMAELQKKQTGRSA